MEHIHKFTEQERRIVEKRQAALMEAVMFIAEMHELKGQVTLAQDLSGIVNSTPQSPPTPSEQSEP